MPFIFRRADNLGKLFSKINNKKFREYAGKIDNDLRTLEGNYDKFNSYQYISLQFFAAAAGMLFCALFISVDIFFLFFAGLLFFFLPLIKIKEEIKKRRETIFKQLPDMADLLSIMLESGADFFGAADKATVILKGPLSDEFKSVLSKISFGYDKKKALNEMVQKTGVEQLGFFVRTINMSLDSGAGMAGTLKRIAAQIRNERASLAEKKAQEAPVKMLIPLVLFIFPTIFIVIFGPIVINFIKTGGF
ncbi:MAG: type II secretion system F family protein [Endomicrobia bacterium]|nr:type II secretion system F family protein [Endomicrobiia bacterium]MCL2799062.1 type II secretion system F family protein [Endomicrobiia bacterium]